MKTLLCAVLAALTSTASAQPACKPSKAVLFAIDHEVDVGTKGPTSTIKLFDNGAWTKVERDADGKQTTTGAGCLAKDVLQTIRKDLQASPWTITHPKIRCMAKSTSYTVFSVKGKTVFKQELCGSDILDEKSQKNLDEIQKLLAAAK